MVLEIVNNKEKVEFIRSKFSQYNIELTVGYYNEEYKNYLYDIKIIFTEDLTIYDELFLDDIISKIDIIKEEFEKINLEKYRLMCKELTTVSRQLTISNFINLHFIVNNFNAEEYKEYDSEMLKYLHNINNMDFIIKYDFKKNIIEFSEKIIHYNISSIIFVLNEEGGRVFSNFNVIKKMKLLLYYSKVLGFEKELLNSIEKIMLGGGLSY